jgi:hypothetical protein
VADGRRSLLGGDEPNYTDLTFAAFTGVWIMPAAYGGGKADDVRVERDQVPAGMRSDLERWLEAFPGTVAWVEALYESRGTSHA